MTDLAILDLGYGNTRSVGLAFSRLGLSPVLTADPDVAEKADRLILPGVGAAGVAMHRLRALHLDEVIARRTRPTLGICLGMQLLFEESAEDGGTTLLGRLPGRIQRLAPAPGFPVPHMGWSKLHRTNGKLGVRPGDYVYFAHGYVCPNGDATAASANHGEVPFPAVLRFGNLWGAQFHPERSSEAGTRFLQAFLDS